MQTTSLNVPTSNGNGTAVTYDKGWSTIYFTGTFDSGTLTFQVSDDGTNYLTVKDVSGADVSCTANAYFNFYLAGPVLVRVTLSGSSGSTSVVANIRPGTAAVSPNAV